MTASTPRRRNIHREMHAAFVEHPNYQAVVQEIEDALDLYEEDGEVATLPCIPVVGPSGVGKTTVFKQIKAAYPRVQDGRRVQMPDGTVVIADHVPLLCVTLPASRISVERLGREMLKELGDPHASLGKPEGLDERLDRLTRGCGVKGVLIDEGQRVVDRAGVLTAEKLIDWIKDRHANNNACFFLFGLNRMKPLFEQDAQFDRRWDVELEMTPYVWGDDADEDLSSRDAFIGLLAGLQAESPVPFAQEVDVTDDETAKRFFYASRGLTGGLKKLLTRAMRIIIARGREAGRAGPAPEPVIDFTLLREAFDKAFRTERAKEKLINPFGPQWDGRLPPAIAEENYVTAAAKDRRRKEKLRKARNVRKRSTKAERRNELAEALTK